MADKLQEIYMSCSLRDYEQLSHSGEHTYLLSHPRSGSHWFRYAYAFITRDDIYIGLRWPVASVVELDEIPEDIVRNHLSMAIASKNYGFGVWALPSIVEVPYSNSTPEPATKYKKWEFFSFNSQPADWCYSFYPNRPFIDIGYVLLSNGKIYKYDTAFMQQIANSRNKTFGVRLDTAYPEEQGILWATERAATASSFGMQEILEWSPRHGTHAINHTLTSYHWADEVYKNSKIIKTPRLPPHIETDNIKLLCLIRNYKECLYSQMVQDGLTNVSQLTIDNFLTDNHLPSYMKILQTYDEFPNQKKLIYYEDLMSNTHEILNDSVINFARSDNIAYENEMKKNLTNLSDNSQKHKHISLQNYRKGAGKAQTGGNSVDYYSNLLSTETKRLLDEYVLENYPKLTEKYLQRYQEAK